MPDFAAFAVCWLSQRSVPLWIKTTRRAYGCWQLLSYYESLWAVHLANFIIKTECAVCFSDGSSHDNTYSTFSVEEPSEVSSPSLSSSQGLRVLGFFFLLLLSLSLPSLSPSDRLSSAPGNIRIKMNEDLRNPQEACHTVGLDINTSSNLHHPRLAG